MGYATQNEKGFKMNNQKMFSKRQGKVVTHNHPGLKFGQYVSILDETPDMYRVQVFPNGLPQIIAKEDLEVN